MGSIIEIGNSILGSLLWKTDYIATLITNINTSI